MSQFEPEDTEGSPWMMLVAGALCFLLAWYISGKTGSDAQSIGKAGLLYSLMGKKGFVLIMTALGAYFFGRGLWKMGSDR